MPRTPVSKTKSVCPRCHKPIASLNYVSKRNCLGTFASDGTREDDPFTEDEFAVKFSCPECLADLFTEEDDALRFLNGILKDVTVPLSFYVPVHGKLNVRITFYADGGGMAVELVNDAGEYVGVLSINLPEFKDRLGSGEFFAKTGRENKEIAQFALLSSIFEDTGRRVGTIKSPIWKIR